MVERVGRSGQEELCAQISWKCSPAPRMASYDTELVALRGLPHHRGDVRTRLLDCPVYEGLDHLDASD
jgi:hypothetical protein